MQFENGIWQQAFDVYRLNLKSVAIAIAAAIGLDLLTEYLGSSGSYRTIADLIIWGMVAISMHGTVLRNEVNLGTSDSKLLMPFVWRSLVLGVLILVPTIIAVFVFYDEDLLATILKALPVIGLAALIVFSLWGTWLPATVVNGDKGFGTALSRGTRTFTYTVPRLLLGPGIVQVILLAVGVWSTTQGIMAGQVFGEAGFSLIDLIALPFIYALYALLVTILAVILSRAYLIAEEAAHPRANIGRLG